MISIIISIPFINSSIPPRFMNFSINSITLSLPMRFQHLILNWPRSFSLSRASSKKRFLNTPTPSLRKKKVAPKKGKSEMVVFVVPAKRRSFAKRMKWVNLFFFSAKHFFSLVELSTKKAMRERILLSKLFPCAFALPIVDGSATPGATKWLRTTTGSKWIWFFLFNKYCMTE